MNEKAPEKKSNGVSQLLTTLAASGDKWVQIAIIALVAITGGGNFLATQQVERVSVKETDRAISEIHSQLRDIYGTYGKAQQRQMEMAEAIKRIEDRLNQHIAQQQH